MTRQTQCGACRDGQTLPFSFTMAFQPIIDSQEGRIWGHEALVRGTNGEGAGAILAQVTHENRYRFDQECRIRAIQMAAKLFPVDQRPILSINFMPNAVYEPEACLRATLQAARKSGFPLKNIMFELTEGEKIDDIEHVKKIIAEYKKWGLITAIDDFGAGFAGLSLLADFQPDLIKIDMHLVRDIHKNIARQAIVTGIVRTALSLDIMVIAEGIETKQEFQALKELGVTLFQGYYFARPRTGALSPVNLG
ncbi:MULTISPECIES: EAL domain-containing protein [unclassified Iodidimonas]|jgi:EAL domain-containing protein (putative c-di-GMP-specific phosphodiesterase class I)|uniref:EAL domain-containing protein n=1 Tax=unclassified Iodidimonas TaxID=2626145 RepID=UPI002482BC22|nr:MULTISPECIES: EAL domain-containing protein [unclassified Iodidimonas]